MSGARSWLERLGRWGTALENAVLVLLLGAMVLLAVGQIVLRIGFSTGFVWADELVSLIVLWLTIVASVAAARSDKHLRIDALSHFVSAKYARVPRIVVDAFAAGMCLYLAWHAWRYLQLTREFGDTVLNDLPAWLAYGIVPLGFLLMAYRFLLQSISGVLKALAGDDAGESQT